MRFLGCTYALVAAASLGACQARASEAPPAGPEPIVARDASGTEIARITRTQPCQIQLGATSATIATRPLLVELAGARWTGETTTAGTLLRKGSDLAARVLDTGATLAVFDPTGAAWIRVDAQGTVHGAGGQLLRSTSVADTVLHVGDATVTGTRDPVLAAALVSPEVPSDVRALVACSHLIPNEATIP